MYLQKRSNMNMETGFNLVMHGPIKPQQPILPKMILKPYYLYSKENWPLLA